MAKRHSQLTGVELHNPKGIGVESGSLQNLIISASNETLVSSGSFLPTTTNTYNLGSAAKAWSKLYVISNSIEFVNNAGATIQTLTADSLGVSMGSGQISGSAISGSGLMINGSGNITGDLTLGGNITIGDAASDSITVSADFTSNLVPNADETYDLGSSGQQWRDIYIQRIGYIDQLGTDGDPTTAYIGGGEIDSTVIGGETPVAATFTTALVGSATDGGTSSGSLHPSSSLTILMAGKAGMMLPSASSDPSGLSATAEGMAYFNTDDAILKIFDGTAWIPAGDINTKNTHLTMSADIDGNGANSTMLFRIDGQDDSDVKFRLKSDDSHEMTGSVDVSGSITATSVHSASTSITTNNITNGYPTSNPWGASLEGSYFNNFDNTTHVSEILRFVAGAMSHSLDVADASANTRTFASVDTNENSLGSTTTIGGYLPQSFGSISNATLDYLNSKDLWRIGSESFDGITTYYQNGATHYVDFDSNSGGSSTVSSSADSELFGLGGLTSGGATAFKVRVHATQSFSDTGSIAAPDESSNTFTTQSRLDLSVSAFGTSNGLELAKIATDVPAVIPAAYQDGKFENVGGTTLSGSLNRKHHATNANWASVSASGYYRFHGLKIGMASGSGDYQEVNGTTKNRFWAPMTTINTAVGDNTIADVGTAVKVLTATSRSLSGTPYLIDATYEMSSKITGLFNPAYAGHATLVNMTAASVGTGTAGGTVTITSDTVSTAGGTVQNANTIYNNAGSSARATGTVPYYNDIVLVSASVSYDSGTSDSVDQTGVADTSFTVALYGRDRDGSNDTLDTQTISYHTAGNFSQPAASGSLAIYGRAQGYDGGTLQGTTETFSGEDFRIKLLDNVQAFNGTAWTTTYALDQLGNYDLQVKPGYLVDPGGDYRYWHPASYGSGTYKYYIRRFQTGGSTYSSMTVNLNNNTLIAWNATTDGISCALLFESSGKNSGNNASLGVARIYDPVKTTSNLIEADMAADNFKNPFSTAISLYGNFNGSIASGTYTVPIRNGDGMYLDSNDNELYVIVRYKGDPSPVTSITLAYS
jgi:hypothetical protein